MLNLKSSLWFAVLLNVDVLLSPLQSLENSLIYKKKKLVYHMINVIAFTELAGKRQAGKMF